MKKGWFIGCGIAGVLGIGVCAGVIGIFVYGIFSITQPVVDASEEFLRLLGQEKIAEAYGSTSAGYRAQQDEESFTLAVKQVGLTKYASASWSNRQIKNQQGSTAGTVTNKDGGTSPIALTLIQEDGQWKVASVNYSGVDLTTIKTKLALPADDELRKLATQSLLDFDQAVQAKDFAPFHETLSDPLKKAMTPAKLQDAFQVFVDKQIGIAGIKDVAPTYDAPPVINDKGELILVGRYPTQPVPVRFTLEYIRERGNWKLTTINVNVGKG